MIDGRLIAAVLKNAAEREKTDTFSRAQVHANWLKKQYKNWPEEKKAVRKEQIAKRKKLA